MACLLGPSHLTRKWGFLPAPNPGSCWEAWLASPSFPVLAISPRPRQHTEHVGLRLEETPNICPETGSSWPKRRAFKITQMNWFCIGSGWRGLQGQRGRFGLSLPNHEQCDLEREAGGWLGNPHFLGGAPEERSDPKGRHTTSGQPHLDLYTTGLLLGVLLVSAQKIVTWPSRGCLEREVTGSNFGGSGFCGHEKTTSEIKNIPPTITWPLGNPCRQRATFSWPYAQAHSWHTPTSYIIFASETNLVNDLATL